MDDLLGEFLTETAESLAVLDVELVNLERNPNDKDILSNIFRLVHTIKGTCGFLGLPRLESIAHAGENVLGKFRDGALEVTPDAVTLILEVIDQIKEILAYIEQNEVEPEGDDADLKARLAAVERGEGAAQAPAASAKPAAPASGGPVAGDGGFPVAAELLAEVEAAQASGAQAATEEEIMAEMAAAMAAEEASAPAEPEPAPPAPTARVPAPAAKPPVKAEKPAETKIGASDDGGAKEPSIASQSIRVNVDVLEDLMTMVSELVLTRNQLLQMVRGRDSEFAGPLQRLSHITTELQEGVMKTRMQPIGNAWAKLPRIVRDLTIETGKRIDLQMLGAETELDRQVLELIKDPLTHMVRNSADHGLEGPEERAAAGKPETGIIRLNAFHEGGHIIIEISDDGKGLNLDRIAEKAVANGLATEAEVEAMSDQQIAQFIFRAGLSTAQKVTSVSGRGVGMDVVRTNIEKIGGTIELKTFRGKGSTFIIKIPLTLAIVSALIVEAAKERFAIPQISVLELVRVTAQSEQCIETINDAAVLRLRDRLLPLVDLSELLKLDRPKSEDTEADPNDHTAGETFIVVAQVGTYTFGITVDRVFDTEEIVVKPVAPILRNITMFSGNTILGDGSVIMILDPNGIASATGDSSALAAEQGMEQAKEQITLSSEEKTSLLVFRAAGASRAVPLGLVARLEELDVAKIEHSYGKPVVQYRGQLMPLVGVSDPFTLREEGTQPILVFSDRDRSMGLVVDEIVDIVEDVLDVELTVSAPGILGTAVIGGKATDVIDTSFYLTKAFGDWFARRDAIEEGSKEGARVLLVDDSAFFRNLLPPVLSSAGYRVMVANGPTKAMALLEQGFEPDIIVSDIEMPDMDGFSFAETLRKHAKWGSVPMIALSSRATAADFDRGREVGFNDYVMKVDKEALLTAVDEVLKGHAGAAVNA